MAANPIPTVSRLLLTSNQSLIFFTTPEAQAHCGQHLENDTRIDSVLFET